MPHLPEANITCHDTAHKKKCRDLCMNCWKWVQVSGTDPSTGHDVSDWKCSDAWLPFLLIENSQMQRQTGAAVESFRNEMTQANAQTLQALIMASNQQLLNDGGQ